jgi:hypothetical protein
MEITKAVVNRHVVWKIEALGFTFYGSDRSSQAGSRYVWGLSWASAPEKWHVIRFGCSYLF